jgi:hypothetical protein
VQWEVMAMALFLVGCKSDHDLRYDGPVRAGFAPIADLDGIHFPRTAQGYIAINH